MVICQECSDIGLCCSITYGSLQLQLWHWWLIAVVDCPVLCEIVTFHCYMCN